MFNLENDMRAYRITLLLAAVLVVALIAGCSKVVTVDNENFLQYDNNIIASADSGYVLTTRDLYAQLWSSQLTPSGGLVDSADLRQLRDSILIDTLTGFLVQEDYDLKDYGPQYRTYRLRYEEFLLNQYVLSLLSGNVKADTATLEKYIAENPERYTVEEQVQVYHILVSPRWFMDGKDSATYRRMDEDELAQVEKDYADSLYNMIQDGAPFQDVAFNYSHDKTTQIDGGYVGWVTRGTYIDPFDSLAFSMDVGTMSEPYHDKDGWHIIYVVDHIPGGLLSLDRPEFYRTVLQGYLSNEGGKLTREIVDSLRKDMTLEINDSVLAQDVFKAPETTWAAVVNGVDTIDFLHMRRMEVGYRDGYRVSNTTPDMKRSMIDRLAGRALAMQAARRAGIDTLPTFLQETSRIRHQALKAVVRDEHLTDNWLPDAGIIEQYYNAHLDEYLPPKPVTIQEIVVSDSILAEFIRDQAMSGIELNELARDYPTGGQTLTAELRDTSDVGEADLEPVMWKAIEKTPAGHVTDIVNIGGDYHVIKVVTKRKVYNLVQARGMISSILIRKHRQNIRNEYLAKLIERYHVRLADNMPRFYLKPLRYRIDTEL